MEQNLYKKCWMIGFIAAVIWILVEKFDMAAAFVSTILAAASPLFIGCVIAYILNLPMKQIEKLYFPGKHSLLIEKTRRPVSILASFLLLFLLGIAVVYLVVPELLSSIRLITLEIPPILDAAVNWAIAHSEELPSIQEYLQQMDMNWQELFRKTVDLIMTGAGGLLSSMMSVVSRVFGVAAQVLIGVIFAIYLLSAKETLKTQVNRFLRAFVKPVWRKRAAYTAKVLHQTFSSFIVGQCLEAVIIGSLCAVGMLVFGLPYAAMTGTVVGATALIPVVGAYIGAAVGAFMVFTVNPFQALFFIVFLVALQQLEGNLIYPRVVGSSIGLPGIWVLAAVTIGGSVMGISGMLLGVPLTAAAYKLMGDVTAWKLGEKPPSCE